MKKLFLTIIASMLIITAMAQGGINLRLNPEQNKVYSFSLKSDQTITQTVNGNQQNVDTKTDYAVSFKMVDKTADFIVAEITFDTLITSTNTMGRQVNISSSVEGDMKSSETTDILSCIMNRLTKNTLYVKIDYSGKPLEIVNLKMVSGIITRDTSEITLEEPMAGAVKKQISNVVSDNTLKTMIGAFTYCLPNREVAKGDKWDITQQTNSGGMMLNIKTTYDLNTINGNDADVAAESAIKAEENAAPMQSGGATITYDDLSGLGKSAMVIDMATGLLTESRTKTHITGNLGVSAPGVSMQIPMDINSESLVTRGK